MVFAKSGRQRYTTVWFTRFSSVISRGSFNGFCQKWKTEGSFRHLCASVPWSRSQFRLGIINILHYVCIQIWGIISRISYPSINFFRRYKEFVIFFWIRSC